MMTRRALRLFAATASSLLLLGLSNAPASAASPARGAGCGGRVRCVRTRPLRTYGAQLLRLRIDGTSESHRPDGAVRQISSAGVAGG